MALYHSDNLYSRYSIAMSLFSAVAMGLVICHHLPTHPQGGILEWGVPWFYFASGFWYAAKPRKWSGEIAKRTRTLLVPYFLLNAIWFPIVFFVNWIGWKYQGAERVVDGSLASIVRCLGFSPYQWPALVPTWFLRSLFVSVAIVGGLWSLGAQFEKWRNGGFVWRVIVAVLLVCIHATRRCWVQTDFAWDGFFVFGVPLHGMACFAVGGVVARAVGRLPDENQGQVANAIRRQLMPIYVLHAVVIVAIGWVAKAFGCFEALATLPGDIAMWFVGVAGAIAIGEAMRRQIPNVSRVFFGGR